MRRRIPLQVVARNPQDSARHPRQLRREEFLSAILESSTDCAIITTDLSRRITSWNVGARKLLGYTEDEILGSPLDSVFTPEDRAAGIPERELRQALETGRADDDRWHVTKDGRRLFVNGVATPLRIPGDGPAIGVVKVIHDRTAHKQWHDELRDMRDRLQERVDERTRELRQAHESLRATERMAALGTLAAGLGHDLANLLFPVRSRLDALEAIPLPPDAKQEVAALRESVGYLRRLANGLRLMISPAGMAASQGPTNLFEWWLNVQGLLRAALPGGVKLEGEVVHGLPEVAIGDVPLTQAVFNLVQNAGRAIQAGGLGGRVRLAARETRLGEAVELRVSDTGPGMSDEVARRCFEPYFTTGTEGATGLGLSIVRSLLEAAGAGVEFATAPGRGTEFVITLPAAGPSDREGSRPAAAVSITDDWLAGLVVALLRARGFEASRQDTPGPDAKLWVVTAETTPGAVLNFVEACTGRRAVVIGTGKAPHDQVVAVPEGAGLRTVRDAVEAAAAGVTA